MHECGSHLALSLVLLAEPGLSSLRMAGLALLVQAVLGVRVAVKLRRLLCLAARPAPRDGVQNSKQQYL